MLSEPYCADSLSNRLDCRHRYSHVTIEKEGDKADHFRPHKVIGHFRGLSIETDDAISRPQLSDHSPKFTTGADESLHVLRFRVDRGVASGAQN